MFPINRLKIVQPNLVEAGTALLGGVQYDYAPMFVFKHNDVKYRFDFDKGNNGFTGIVMATNLNRYFFAGDTTLLVDLNSKISPSRSDIPHGSVLLIGDTVCYAIKFEYQTVYVTLAGALLDTPKTYDDVIAFAKWKLVVSASDDEWHTVYEAP